MVDKLPPKWPNWDQPASKGDVLSALVMMRSSIIHILGALSASKRGDPDGVNMAINNLFENDVKLNDLIRRIGGDEND
jgi:hypothetical protein